MGPASASAGSRIPAPASMARHAADRSACDVSWCAQRRPPARGTYPVHVAAARPFLLSPALLYARRPTMSSFASYLLGFLLFTLWLGLAAPPLNTPSLWLAVGVVVL